MKRILNRIFTFISSIKFTIILLVMFLLTILADVMERGIISFVRGLRLPGGSLVGNVLNGYFAGDVHSSSWFTGLMILFTLNLLACMVKHIPETLRAMSLNSLAEAHAMPSSPLFQDAFTVSGLRDGFYQGLYRLLAENIARPSAHHSATRSIFFCQRGRLHHGGFYLAHSGLLMVLAGGFLGSYSLSGEMYLREGESDDRVFFKENGNPCFRRLDYAIRLDECEPVGSTSGSSDHSQATYQTTVTLLQEDKNDVREKLEGYRTITRDGIRISQSRSPGKDRHQIILSILSPQGVGKRRSFTLKRYQCCTIPETGHTIRLKDIFFRHHFPADSFQKTSSVCPASCMVTLEVYGNNNALLYKPRVTAHAGSPAQPWDKEYEFRLDGIEACESASRFMRLIVSTEPGAGLIWTGAGIAIAGFSLMFMLAHRKIWIAIENGGGDYCVTVAGWASRNPDVLEHYAGLIKKLAL
jgi:cytochrome c biogenesis protein